MRRRTMVTSMSAVAVAVVLLGVPLGGGWIILALRTTADRSGQVSAIVTVVLTILILTVVALAAAAVVASKAARRLSAPPDLPGR